MNNYFNEKEDVIIGMEKDLRTERLNIAQLTFTVFELVRKVERGDIQLESAFQRKYRWPSDMKSALIESIILGIPIQMIFLTEAYNNKYEIIDGGQRIKTITDFVNNRFQLKSGTLVNENKFFRDLEPIVQRKIEDYKMSVLILNNDTDLNVMYDIFNRLNNASTKINSQELRNFKYRDKGMPFIKKLADEEDFKRLIQGINVNTNSMQDEQLVLRFMAFYYKGFKAYTGNLKKFLDSILEEYDIYEDREDEFRHVFIKTVNNIYNVFGNEAFVINNEIRGRNNKKKKINVALFDILMVSFSKYSDISICENKNSIRSKLDDLLENNERFIMAITGAANTTKAKTHERFEIWENCLEKILGGK